MQSQRKLKRHSLLSTPLLQSLTCTCIFSTADKPYPRSQRAIPCVSRAEQQFLQFLHDDVSDPYTSESLRVPQSSFSCSHHSLSEREKERERERESEREMAAALFTTSAILDAKNYMLTVAFQSLCSVNLALVVGLLQASSFEHQPQGHVSQSQVFTMAQVRKEAIGWPQPRLGAAPILVANSYRLCGLQPSPRHFLTFLLLAYDKMCPARHSAAYSFKAAVVLGRTASVEWRQSAQMAIQLAHSCLKHPSMNQGQRLLQKGSSMLCKTALMFARPVSKSGLNHSSTGTVRAIAAQPVQPCRQHHA